MLFSFSLDSDFIFDKNAPCQLFRLNFKNKSDFLTTISRLNCPPLPDYDPVELHWESWIERGSAVILIKSLIFQCVYQWQFPLVALKVHHNRVCYPQLWFHVEKNSIVTKHKAEIDDFGVSSFVD